MSNSIKISQLNSFVSTSREDFVPLVDSSSMTTYRTNIDSIGKYVAANYPSAFATQSLFATQSINSYSASLANTASFALIAQYALSGNNASSSFASSSLSASYVKNAVTASNLYGSGTSKENTLIISTSLVIADKANIELPPHNGNYRQNSVFFNSGYGVGPGNDYARIYYSESIVDNGRLVFSAGDNVDALEPLGPNLETISKTTSGFLFETNDGANTGSLAFITTGGRLYTRVIESRVFTSSLTIGVGFLGTASFAVKATTAYTASVALTANTASYMSGYSPLGVAKAWALISGSGQVISSYNVSSCSVDSAWSGGKPTIAYYTLMFTNNPFANANYAMAGVAWYITTNATAMLVVPRVSNATQLFNKTTSSISLVVSDNSTDGYNFIPQQFSVVFYGA